MKIQRYEPSVDDGRRVTYTATVTDVPPERVEMFWVDHRSVGEWRRLAEVSQRRADARRAARVEVRRVFGDVLVDLSVVVVLACLIWLVWS